MFRPEAFIFDLNGTMIDDMEYHTTAWARISGRHLRVSGPSRGEVANGRCTVKMRKCSVACLGKVSFSRKPKTDPVLQNSYQLAFRPHLQLIAGLPAFLEAAEKRHIRLAIGSAAIPFNIDFVLDNLAIRHYFQTIAPPTRPSASRHPDFLKGYRIGCFAGGLYRF